jgi:integrase
VILWEHSEKRREDLVFGITTGVKRSFATACRIAGITDFRFHDLRHTAITWMLEAGMPHAKVMKISGHTQMSTFLRYLNVNAELVREAAALLDARHAPVKSQETSVAEESAMD